MITTKVELTPVNQNGEDGRTIVSGRGSPALAVGRLGDFFYDTLNGYFYGPKTFAGWGVGTRIGQQGWTPIPGIANDGGRRVLQVVDWQGGSGAKPATLGYLGSAGIVSDIAEAIDVRGATGDPTAAEIVTLIADDEPAQTGLLDALGVDASIDRVKIFDTRTQSPVLAEVDPAGAIVRQVFENRPRANQLDVTKVLTRATYAGVPIIDTDRRIVGFVSAGEPSQAAYPEDDIRAFAPGIDLTGTIDESAALKGAHDAAAAAGLTSLYIEGPINAPSAIFLGDVHFRTRTGKGRLIGTYRKRVIPETAAPLAALNDVVPETHLAAWNAAVAAATPSAPAILCYMSDSWGQPNQLVGATSYFEELLRQALWAQYGTKALDGSIVIVNRAIGGSTWLDAAGVGNAASVPGWYLDPEADWLDYVTTLDLTGDGLTAAEAPHLVILAFGMNHGAVMEAATFDAIEHVVDTVQAISPAPDVLLVPGTVPSSMSPTRGAKVAQEARASMAGIVRSVAAMRGLGVIDFGRQFDAAHWGFDPRLPSFQRVRDANAAITLPYAWPEETSDFAINITVPDTDAAFWATGDGLLTVTLSSVPGNVLILERDSGTGNIAVTVNACTGRTSIPRTVTELAGHVGYGGVLSITARGPSLYVMWRWSVVLNRPVIRGGGQFTPTIGFGGASIDVTANIVARANLPAVNPYLTDAEAWGNDGTDAGDIGGNDENHLSEPGRSEIFAKLFHSTRFR
ncbi:SGNH/GDSL hydrolase family protein [Acuticoccus sp. M5D2P5]|uniref:SGNH/GDSL hydrolase family protein n=1 Tax=Acuticoccus kalidii TaxID=2910977 RepID=UPI001F2620A2|nr:SGNH/GDSL hydrolase family protein [Acuticoccus kalidii]MCF3935388.1 SGNH/GDSL hydrolase family protein [Acuticoccus kalidii]